MSTNSVHINYDDLLLMLNSDDEENVVLAFSCINHCDIPFNAVKIMCLRFHSKQQASEWRSSASNAVDFLKKRGMDFSSPINFKDIIQVMKKMKEEGIHIPDESIDCFFQAIMDKVLKDVREAGFTDIKKIKTEFIYE